MAAGKAGKHGKITQTFVSALFLPQILQGTSPPRQRAAGQIPPKRTGHLNEPRGRRCFLAIIDAAGQPVGAAGQATDVSGTGLAVATVRRGSRGAPRAVPG